MRISGQGLMFVRKLLIGPEKHALEIGKNVEVIMKTFCNSSKNMTKDEI